MELYFNNFYRQSGSGRVAVMPYDIQTTPPVNLTELCDYLESIGWVSRVTKDNQNQFIWMYVSPPNVID